MLKKKKDVSIGSFKIKLLKAPAITNTPPPPPTSSPKKKKNNVDQDEMKGGVIVVPNPQDRRPVG